MKKRKVQQGSITPFLALILILMLAMLGTLLEAARVQTAKNIAKEAINTATESVLSQFYLPLYEDYHVFFMERGIDTEELEQKELLETIKEYMLYTFDADADLKGGKLNLYSDFYGLKTENAVITKIVRATENNGNLFRAQAIEYSKYAGAGQVLENFWKRLDLLKSSQRISEIVGKKLEAEDNLSEVSSKILQIIELVEGISCNSSKTAFLFTNSGGLKSEEVFAKQFSPNEITSTNVGIENEVVWDLLKKKYKTPVSELKGVKKTIIQIEENVEKINQLSEKIENLKNKVNLLENELQQKNNENADEKEVLFQLQEEVKNLEEELLEKKSKQESNINKVNRSIKEMAEQAEKIKEKSKEVIKIIPQLEQKQEQSQGKLQEYENTLSGNASDLTKELKTELTKDLEGLKQYVSKETEKNSYVTQIVNMKPILETNSNILEKMSAMSKMSISLDNLEQLTEQKKMIENLIESFKGYHIASLKFNYSTLKLKNNTKNPIDIMNHSFTDGVLEMLLPSDVKLSNKSLPKADYYFSLYSKNKNITENTTQYQEKIAKSQNQGKQSEISKSFISYGSSISNVEKNSQALLEKMLFQQYFTEHFKSYTNEIEKNQKETVLDYEQEYLLSGKEKDKDNLKAVMNKVIFIRTIMNFIYLLTDSAKKKVTYATAASLVGMSGLEPLVRLTQTLILLTWSYEEALVDTGGLLTGKSVPFMKDKTTFMLTYPDMLCISKTLIQSKIAKMKENGNGIAMKYKNYLQIFLMMELDNRKSYRAMDLIESNLQKRYKNTFHFSKAIYGMDVVVDISMRARFLQFPLIRSYSKQNMNGWKFQFTQSHSY